MVTPKVTRANTDSEMILSWLNNKQSINTQKHYAYTIKHFLEFVGKDLSQVKIEDIQDFWRSLQLRNQQLSTIKVKLMTKLIGVIPHLKKK